MPLKCKIKELQRELLADPGGWENRKCFALPLLGCSSKQKRGSYLCLKSHLVFILVLESLNTVDGVYINNVASSFRKIR